MLRSGLVLGVLVTGVGCGATRRPLDVSKPWDFATRAAEHPFTKIPVEVPEKAKPPPPESLPEALKEKVTLRSEAIDIRSLMLGLAKQTGLNITLDPDVTGQVSAYFNDVSVIDALRNIADQLGAEVEIKNNVVSVHRPRKEWRMFRLHYLRDPRVGQSNFGVVDRAQTPTTGLAPVAPAAPPLTGATAPGGISVPPLPIGGGSVEQIVSVFSSNFWEDLDEELVMLVFEGIKKDEMTILPRNYSGITATDLSGRSLVVDSMSGTIMVRAGRAALQAVADFLDAVGKTVQRQILIDVQILEVTFSDETIFGIEGSNVPFLPSSLLTGPLSFLNQNGFTGNTGVPNNLNPSLIQVSGSTQASTGLSASITTPLGFPNLGAISATAGTGAVNPLTPTTPVYAINLWNSQTTTPGNQFPFQLMVQALGQLGDVKYVSAPRLSALHNQKALLKVVQDKVYYNVQGGAVTPATATSPEIIAPATITPIIVPEGVSLDVTPLVDDDGAVTLHVHPSFSVIIDAVTEPGGNGGSQPEVERREFDTTVRVLGEQTIVLGGMVSEHSMRSETGLPLLKDIPVIGGLFRDTTTETDKSELIILLTPRVQNATLLRETVNEFRAFQGQDPMPEPDAPKSK